MDPFVGALDWNLVLEIVVMANALGAFACRRRGEAAGVGTWRMVARLARRKNRILHIVSCSEQKKTVSWVLVDV